LLQIKNIHKGCI